MGFEMNTEKIIGILGGMGPEATVDIFLKIMEACKATVDQDYVRVIMDFNSKIPDRQSAILEHTQNPGPAMADTAKNLENAGADFIIIGSNTPYYFLNYVEQAVTIPVLNIIEETIVEVKKQIQGVKKVGVLATTGAIKTKIFHRSFAEYGIDVIDLPKDLQKDANDIRYSYKFGRTADPSMAKMVDAAEYMIDHGAQAIIMGCTEIPLLLNPYDFSVPKINPNEIISKVAVQFARNQIER